MKRTTGMMGKVVVYVRLLAITVGMASVQALEAGWTTETLRHPLYKAVSCESRIENSITAIKTVFNIEKIVWDLPDGAEDLECGCAELTGCMV